MGMILRTSPVFSLIVLSVVCSKAMCEETPYLQSDGTQAIQTDYYAKPTTKLLVDYACVEAEPDVYIVGARTPGSIDGGLSCAVFNLSSTCQAWSFHENGGNRWLGNLQSEVDKRYVISVDYPGDRVEKFVDGVSRFSERMSGYTSGVTANARYPQAVFADNYWGKFKYNSKIKLYSLKYFENGVVVRDYVPYVQNGVAGLKDQVTGLFHVSATGSTLAYGGDVKTNLNEPYLQSDGTQAILTDYYAKPTTRVVVDYEYVDSNAGGTYILGARSPGNANAGLSCSISHQNSGALAWSFHETGLERWFGSAVPALGIRYVVSVDYVGDSAVKYADGAVSNSVVMSNWTSNLTAVANYPQAVFANNNQGTLQNRSKIKLYAVKYLENGIVVRDFKPYVKDGVAGLRDAKSGNFFAPASGGLSYGGDIESNRPSAYDAWLESDGTQAIMTDYCVKPTTKLVVDYACVEAEPDVYIVGARTPGSNAGRLSCAVFNLSSTCQAWSFHENGGNRWLGNLQSEVGKRYVISVDYPSDRAEKFVDGVSRFSEQMSGNTSGVTANAIYPQAVFADNYWGKFKYNSKIRLYSLKYFENGSLVRQFLPYKSGDVVGLYDTETGNVYVNSATNANPFKIGGAGVDGSQLACLVKPKNSVLRRGIDQKLFAYAPGAVSYRWFRNGEELAGENKAELSVSWDGTGGEKVYKVIPVFDVFGRQLDGEAAECLVSNPFLIILFK